MIDGAVSRAGSGIEPGAARVGRDRCVFLSGSCFRFRGVLDFHQDRLAPAGITRKGYAVVVRG
jgi:hypothetical protein